MNSSHTQSLDLLPLSAHLHCLCVFCYTPQQVLIVGAKRDVNKESKNKGKILSLCQFIF